MRLSIAAVVLGIGFCAAAHYAAGGGTRSDLGALPPPAVDEARAAVPSERTAVFAGGCFWGVEAVFEHVRGVKSAESGYTGGAAHTARYDDVSGGTTGHLESVRVTYDPSQVTYGQLLRVFFSVAHDPTQADGQGPDIGSQYHAAVLVADDGQRRIARSYLEQLGRANVFPKPIATKVVDLGPFYTAEEYHQNYVERNPGNAYVKRCDLPKLDALKRDFPDLYVAPTQ
jgi:peptide-methionine (S)-S-oxide reductase